MLRFVDEFLPSAHSGSLCLLAAEPLQMRRSTTGNESLARHGAGVSDDCGWVDLGNDALLAARPNSMERKVGGTLVAAFRFRTRLRRGDSGLCVRGILSGQPLLVIPSRARDFPDRSRPLLVFEHCALLVRSLASLGMTETWTYVLKDG